MITIYPRYHTKNRRYRVRVPKEKMPYEKKLAIRSLASLCIFVVLCVVSLFGPPPHIKSALNTTYSKKGWQSFFAEGVHKIQQGIQKTKSAYSEFASAPGKAPAAPDISAGETVQAQMQNVPPPQESSAAAKWTAPAKGSISSHFGEREHPINGEEKIHTGIDIAANEGDTVVAAYPGTVVSTGCDSANGNYVVIDHGEGLTTTYIHLKTISITVGEYASPEIKIGEVGSTGISTGPHLHFEIKKDGKSVNPEEYITFAKGSTP